MNSGNPLVFLVQTAAGIYIGAVLLRFLLQLAKADFYNPLSQAIFKATNPPVKVFRSFIPALRGLDLSCIVLAFVLQCAAIVVLSALYGLGIPPLTSIITWAVAGVILFIISIYYWAILGTIIASFAMMFSGTSQPHPYVVLLWQLTEPIMGPVRKVLPPMGGLDFSPILVFIAIGFVQRTVIQAFQLTQWSSMVTLGF